MCRAELTIRAWAIIILLAAAVPANGQDRASIVGTITDPEGRAVAHALVQARRTDSVTVFRGTTGASGDYTLGRLPAGTYAVVVPAIGFSLNRFEQNGIVVGPSEIVRFDIRLQWGSNLGTPGDDQSTFNIRKYGTQRGPAPRTRDGKPDFSGVWIGNNDPDPEQPALMPWATAVTQARIANDLAEHPSGFCLPSFPFPGGPLVFELVQTPDRLITIFETMPTYRKVYLDGRRHPKDPNPSWMGHSIGRWDRDTLVIDSLGFNDKSWLEIFPHTEMLHVIERYRRPDKGHLEIEVTVEDPGTFAKPFVRRSTWDFAPEEDVLEYICAENNQAAQRLGGAAARHAFSPSAR
jgi:hypothetical protein